MANYHTFFVHNGGVPATGLAPTWQYLKHVVDGTDYTPQPSITEIGGGWYKYVTSLTDFQHIAGVIDAGAAIGNASRYISQDIRFSTLSEKEKKEVVVSCSYDEDTLALSFMVSLLINGELVTTGVTSLTVAVYDENHLQQFSENTTSFTNGIGIITTNNPSLTKNKMYYAIVSVVETFETVQSAMVYLVLE